MIPNLGILIPNLGILVGLYAIVRLLQIPIENSGMDPGKKWPVLLALSGFAIIGIAYVVFDLVLTGAALSAGLP